MNIPKKQHYVPKFYLKSFGNPIYCYDKLNDKIYLTNPKDIGQQNHYYDLKDLPAGTMESLLSNGDGRFSQAYNRLLSVRDLSKLTTSEKVNFFNFLAVQFLRTPDIRYGIKEMTDKVLENIFGKDGMKVVSQDLKVSYTDDSIRKLQARMIIEDTPKISYLLSKKTWLLKENNTDIPLWTCDNPLALYNELEFSNGMGNLGIVSPGIEIHFPLTPKLILMSYDPKTHVISSVKMDREHVRHHNSYQVTSSTQYLYSNSNDFNDAKSFLQKYPSYKDPNRARGEFTIKKGSKSEFLIYDKKNILDTDK